MTIKQLTQNKRLISCIYSQITDLNNEPGCVRDATSQGAQRTQNGFTTGGSVWMRTVWVMQKV